MLRVAALSGVLVLSVTLAMAAEPILPESLLVNAVKKSIEAKWLSHASPDEKTWYKSSESAEFHRHIANASTASVQCFRQRAGKFSAPDVHQFESVLASYESIFEIPDWESRLSVAIGAPHGADGSTSFEACQHRESPSQECMAAKSARLVFMELYAYLGNCLLRSSEAVSAELQAPK